MNLIQKLLYLPDYLNGYRAGDPNRNGEYRFLKKFLKDKMTVFDIGANVGEYTEQLFSLKKNISVHCFEPVDETFIYLQNKVKNSRFALSVKLNNYGMGDKNEYKELFIYGSLSGANSFYLNDYPKNKSKIMNKINIKISTIDEYIANNNLSFVDFVKIDVEGYEPEVILGAANSIKNDMIDCIQFEYGGTWRNSKQKLTDILNYFNRNNFNIYRLTPWGKIRVYRFVEKLNSFKYSNYIALKKKNQKKSYARK